MNAGDLVRIYTLAYTHVKRGAYGILMRKSVYDDNWWVVYVISECKFFTFHSGQLQPQDEEECDRSGIDLQKSYAFTEED